MGIIVPIDEKMTKLDNPQSMDLMDPELELENFASIYWAFCAIQSDGMPLHL